MATITQPIGHSMDGFVMESKIHYCTYRYTHSLLLEKQMRVKEGGRAVGSPQNEFISLPLDHMPIRDNGPEIQIQPDHLGGWGQ